MWILYGHLDGNASWKQPRLPCRDAPWGYPPRAKNFCHSSAPKCQFLHFQPPLNGVFVILMRPDDSFLPPLKVIYVILAPTGDRFYISHPPVYGISDPLAPANDSLDISPPPPLGLLSS